MSSEVAAEAALHCLGVDRADDVLVLSNDGQIEIARGLAAAAERLGASVDLVQYAAGTRHGEEPPGHVAAAMSAATVILAATTFSLSHTEARQAATAAGARIATMPGITPAVFARALPVDYSDLRRTGERLAAALSAAATCRVVSPAGTDVEFRLDSRVAICDDGNLRAPAAWGNLPAGEAFIAPIETSAEGTIVFDGSLAGYGLVHEPLRVTVVSGRATHADGEAGRWLLDTLDAGGLTGRLIAELGIGTNPRATVSGNILEDEKACGTAHIAFGSSAFIGGTNLAGVHIDGVLRGPAIELDGDPLPLPTG